MTNESSISQRENPKFIIIPYFAERLFPFDRKKAITLENTDFSDCAETSARVVMNLLLYNRVQKTFDLQNLKEHVTGKSLHNPYFENFERFYQKQTPDQANDGGREMRSLWTTVVGDLNAFNDFPKQVRYTKKIRDSGEGFMGGIEREACELTEGFLNFITVFEKIFGLTLEDFPDGKGFDSEKIWVKNALQTLFTTVNPSNTYDMDLANLKKTGSEISGTLPIIVTDRKTNQKLFSFDFYTEPHIHSDVKNLRFLGAGTPENYRYDLPDHRNTIHTRACHQLSHITMEAM